MEQAELDHTMNYFGAPAQEISGNLIATQQEMDLANSVAYAKSQEGVQPTGMNHFGQRRRVDGPLMATSPEMVAAREQARAAAEARAAAREVTSATRERVRTMAAAARPRPQHISPAEQDPGRFSPFYRPPSAKDERAAA